MKNQETLQSVVVSKTKTLDFNNYSMNVSGDPTKGNRRVNISVPVLNDKGMRIDAVNVNLSGDEFNAFWTGFNSEKQLVDVVMRSQGASSDLSQIDDSFLNVAQPARPGRPAAAAQM